MTAQPHRLVVPTYVLARVISVFGSMASSLAVVVWVRELTGSNSKAALSMFIFALPSLCYPLIGRLVDTRDRFRLFLGAQVVGAALTTALLLVHGSSTIWIVYLVQFGQGVNGGVSAISASAMLPTLARREQIGRINGTLQSSIEVARLTAPIVGVLVFAKGGGITPVIAMDAGSFLLCVALLAPFAKSVNRAMAASRAESLAAAAAEGAQEDEPEGYWAGIRGGVALIGADPQIRAVVIASIACLLTLGMLSSVWYALITVGLHHAASFAAVLAPAQAVGGFLGGFAGVWFTKSNKRVVAAAFLGPCGVGASALTMLTGSQYLVVAGVAVLGLGGALLVVVYATVIQSSIRSEVLGKVFSASDAGINIAQVGGIAVGTAWLAGHGSDFKPIVVAGVVLLLPALVLLSRIRPSVEDAEDAEAGEQAGSEVPAEPMPEGSPA